MASKSFDVREMLKAVRTERSRLSAIWKAVVSCESPLCDVKIKVVNECGESVLIGACKHRLMEQSDFFMELFTATSVHRCEELSLHGVSEKAMRAMIAASFGQFDEISINADNIAEYIYVSQKYLVAFLHECCETVIKLWQNKINAHIDEYFNMCVDLHEMGMTKNYDEYSKRINFFQSPSLLKKVFFSPAVFDFPIEILIDLVKCDYLSVCEHSIWQRCLEWCDINGRGSSNNDGNTSSSSADSDSEFDEKWNDEGLIDEDEMCISIDHSSKLDLLRTIKPYIRFPLMEPTEIDELSESIPDLFNQEDISNYHLLKNGTIIHGLESMIKHRHGMSAEIMKLFQVGSKVRYKDYFLHKWSEGLVKWTKLGGQPFPKERGTCLSRLLMTDRDEAVLIATNSYPPNRDDWLLKSEEVVCYCTGPCDKRHHRIAPLDPTVVV